MNFRTLGRWTVKSMRVAALTGAIVLGASSVEAQNGSVPGAGRTFATKKTFTKNNTFNLPIQMDERTRATLKEVRLFVKSGAGDWVQQEVATPQTPHFTYRVPQDGEYWFTLVTVDKSGRQTPSDVNQEPPALRVVVDTRPPVVETTVTPEFGEHVLRVNVIDANPDAQSVRAIVVAEGGDRALAPVPGQPGTFRLSGNDLNLPVRVTAGDMSGNLTSRDILGRDLAAGGAAARPSAPQMLPTAATAPVPTTMPPAAPPPVLASTPYVPPSLPQAPGVIQSAVHRPHFDGGSDKPAGRKILNTTRAHVEYRIDTVGPSGIGRVDVYMTPDRGMNWTKLSEDSDKNSPADIDLPGEGLFGIRLAITNGNGFGGKAPRAGDRPQAFIEVDATSPTVQLHPYEMVPGAGAVDIRWTATDVNFGPEPVSIFYRPRTESNWQPIARNIKNDGVYRWVFPRDIGQHLFLKLEVTDLAGNTTKVETPTPILLDQTEPEATLVDVVGVGGRSAPVPGAIPPSIPGGLPGGIPTTVPPAMPNLATPPVPSMPPPNPIR